jgi:hypothetical protein
MFREVKADGLVHEDLDVAMVAEDGADGLCDFGGRENRKRNLVEQRLKSVVVFAVDECDVDGEMREVSRGVDACESAAENEHALAVGEGDVKL